MSGVRVSVNGEERELKAGTTVADLVQETATSAEQVAVAVNGDVVRQAQWGEAALAEGDRVEIVTAIQGGGGSGAGSGHG